MRLLALLFVLLSMPVLAAATSWPDAEPAGGEVLLAQQTQPAATTKVSGLVRLGVVRVVAEPPRDATASGRLLPSHCRSNEIPCGSGCISAYGGDEMQGEEDHHLRRQALSEAYAAACTAVGPSPASVVRRMSRGSLAGKGRARCMVWRLSHITRSPTRHLWV